MQATVGLVVGVLVGVLLSVVLGRRVKESSRPTALGWTAFALALVAVAAIGLVMTQLPFNAVYSIPIAAAAFTVAIGAIVRRDRHWPTWAGLVLSVPPIAFWLFFFVGELIGPPH